MSESKASDEVKQFLPYQQILGKPKTWHRKHSSLFHL